MSFGGGTKMVETSSDISPRYRDFVDGNLALAGTIANMPNIPYQGARIAEFAADENQAFGNVRGMANSGAGAVGANSLARLAGFDGYTPAKAAAGLGSEFMGAYQNPYEQQVIDASISDAQRANDINNNRAAAGAAMQGALGGSGAAILAAENNRNFLDTVARTGANLRNQGFTTAANLGLADAGNATRVSLDNAQRADAAQQFGLQNQLAASQAAANLGLTVNNALANAGAQQRGMEQADLGLKYGDFLEQRDYPLRQLGIRQSAVGQTPMGSVGRQPVQSGGGLGSALGGFGSLLSGVASFANMCWVAREAYGVEDSRWLEFRAWMLSKAPPELVAAYMESGPLVADYIRDKPREKMVARNIMDRIMMSEAAA